MERNRYNADSFIKEFTREQKEYFREREEEIRRIKDEMNKKGDEILNEMGLFKKAELVFLYYTHAIAQPRKSWLESVKYVTKPTVRLAYLKWFVSGGNNAAIPHFYSVNSKGEIGNHFSIHDFMDISYEPCNCTVEEAKKILKEAKKKEGKDGKEKENV